MLGELLFSAVAVCSWNNTGVDPYQHAPVQGLNAYNLPTNTKASLRERMLALKYDDIVVATRGTIKGSAGEYTDLRNMLFGNNKVCRTVDRSGWADGKSEIGLVYCEGDTCIVVWTVCRNTSMITKVKKLEAIDKHVGETPYILSAGGSVQTHLVQYNYTIPTLAETIIVNQPIQFNVVPNIVNQPIYLLYPAIPAVPELSTLLLSGLGLAYLLMYLKCTS